MKSDKVLRLVQMVYEVRQYFGVNQVGVVRSDKVLGLVGEVRQGSGVGPDGV